MAAIPVGATRAPPRWPPPLPGSRCPRSPYGTEDGVLDSGGYPVPVPVDPRTLQELADTTGGTAYAATTSDELGSVYRDIGSSVGWRTEWREVTTFVAALALVFGLLAAALSLRRFARLI